MTAEDKTRQLGSAPVGPLFLKLAAPAVLGQLAVLLNNVVDRMWVGHIGGDGTLSLGAVGLSLPIHHVFLSFVLMLAVGMSTCVSITLGKGDRPRAAGISGSCFGLALAVNAVTVAVLLVFPDALLTAFGAGEATLPFAHRYLTTLAWGMPFSNTLLMLTMWLTSQGYVSEGVRLNMMNVGVNAVLDPVLIFLAGLGVTGAALATNAGAIVALLWGVRWVRRQPQVLRFGLSGLVPRMELWQKPVLLGLSTLLNVALESLGLLFLNRALQQYGGDMAVAALALFGVPLLVLMNLCLGLSNGAQPIVSFNYGARRPDRVAEAGRLLVRASFACSFALWLVAMAFPRAMWTCFTTDPALLDFAEERTRVCFCVLLTGGIQYAHIYVIKFLGEVRMSLFLGVLKRLLLLLPLIFILPAFVLPGDKVMAVFLALPISEGLAFAVTDICHWRVMRDVLRKEAK